MRIICLSDLHGHLPASLPEGDLIIIAGDICPDHAQWNFLHERFYPWAGLQQAPIVAVWGNHDFIGERVLDVDAENVTFLHDDMCIKQGLRIYGTPYSYRTGDWCDRWAFMRGDSKMPTINRKNVDILISHGPPYKCGDLCQNGDRAGSPKLAYEITRLRPKLVVCGHIHEDAGMHDLSSIPVVNASYVNRQYVPGNEILVVNVE